MVHSQKLWYEHGTLPKTMVYHGIYTQNHSINMVQLQKKNMEPCPKPKLWYEHGTLLEHMILPGCNFDFIP